MSMSILDSGGGGRASHSTVESFGSDDSKSFCPTTTSAGNMFDVGTVRKIRTRLKPRSVTNSLLLDTVTATGSSIDEVVTSTLDWVRSGSGRVVKSGCPRTMVALAPFAEGTGSKIRTRPFCVSATKSRLLSIHTPCGPRNPSAAVRGKPELKSDWPTTTSGSVPLAVGKLRQIRTRLLSASATASIVPSDATETGF